jgi:replicative DNA helicase
VQAKIQQYRPAIVFIDGIYMMQDTDAYYEQGSPQQLTALTRALKRMARQVNIPVVITTQLLTSKMPKRKVQDMGDGTGTTANAIGYSSSFAQDSDMVIAVEHTNVDTTKVVRVVLSRNSKRMWVKVDWNWATGTFQEIPMSGDFMSSVDDEEGDGDAEDSGIRL